MRPLSLLLRNQWPHLLRLHHLVATGTSPDVPNDQAERDERQVERPLIGVQQHRRVDRQLRDSCAQPRPEQSPTRR
jgi:hypothetical protein